MKNISIVWDALSIGVGTLLFGMLEPALVLLGIVATFLFSPWFIPRLGEWFRGAGIAICAGIAALFVLKGVPMLLNTFLVGTFVGSVGLIVMGYIFIRHHRKQYDFLRKEMAELPEVVGGEE